MHNSLTLRPFLDSDTALFARWLRADHVARWYTHPQSWLDEIAGRNGEYAFIHHFITEVDGAAIGFCQYYEYCRGGETWHGNCDVAGAYSIDYLIGEPAFLHRGLAKAIIAELIRRIAEIDGARCIIVQPDPANGASCAALLAAGFSFDRENHLYCYRFADACIIRAETESDHREVEEITRRAFWNVNAPGADEHYLVHIMRDHADFVKELALVVELDHKIIANIMYMRSKLIDENGNEKIVLTFGPLSVLPEYQRRGYGKALQKRSFEIASAMGYDAVVIFGNPENYIPSGFKSCKKYNVTVGGTVFPVALLVRELKEGALDGRRWTFHESPAFNVSPEEAAAFDRSFAPLEKGYRASQELFYIYSRANLVR